MNARLQHTRTNIVLDEKLVRKAMKRAGVKTKREAVHKALESFVSEPDYAGLLALRGSGGVADGYDPKATSPSKWDMELP
jgi:Arc/MetJ family transcription regulator